MSEFRVASRYAKSLMDLAMENNMLDAVYNDIRSFLDITQKSREMENVFNSPIIKFDTKLNIIRQVFGGRVNPLTLSFFEIVVKKHRESVLIPIAEEFVNQYNAHKGISKATVTTAIPMDEALRNEVQAFVEQQTKQKIQLQAFVDPKILGGLVIRFNDNLFDASIATRLAEMKKELTKNYIKN
jgi:F-type H+-transporting ATPase subunit delta